jgi:Cdc6-like AAA superfamily ATPase
MKKLILIIGLICLGTITLLGQINGKYNILDSSKFYQKIDELEKSENIEFTLSVCTVNCEDVDELNIVLEHLLQSVSPKGYVISAHNNMTYYPSNEHITNGTDKKMSDKFFLIRKNGVEDNYSTTILIIGDRVKWEF